MLLAFLHCFFPNRLIDVNIPFCCSGKICTTKPLRIVLASTQSFVCTAVPIFINADNFVVDRAHVISTPRTSNPVCLKIGCAPCLSAAHFHRKQRRDTRQRTWQSTRHRTGHRFRFIIGLVLYKPLCLSGLPPSWCPREWQE